MLGTSDMVTKRMPLLSRVEPIGAFVQTAVALKLSARCKLKPDADDHEISTRFVPGIGWMERTGRSSGVKLLVLVKFPCGVSIVIGPAVAPEGITAVICKSMLFVGALLKVALTPLKSTRVAPVRFVPFSVIVWPG